jgi:hypothetical protein
MSTGAKGGVESKLRAISPFLAVVAFCWGVYTYQDTARRQLAREEAESRRLAETRRIEATRPYLDKQLKLYTDATVAASTIVASGNPEEVASARQRFWQLYWGELALVEQGAVEQSMVEFGKALDADLAPAEMTGYALDLAHACRDELAISWGTDAWTRKAAVDTPARSGE